MSKGRVLQIHNSNAESVAWTAQTGKTRSCISHIVKYIVESLDATPESSDTIVIDIGGIAKEPKPMHNYDRIGW